MRPFIALLAVLVLASAAVMPPLDEADAEMRGSGSSDSLEVSYYLDPADSLYTLDFKVTSGGNKNVSVKVTPMSGSTDVITIPNFPMKDGKASVLLGKDLSEGSYLVLVTDMDQKQLGDCKLDVGHVCNVTYQSNGGSGSMKSSEAVSGMSFELPSCSFGAPEGKEFDSWMVNGMSYPAGASIMVMGETVAVAQWHDAPTGEGDDNLMVIVLIFAAVIFTITVVLFLMMRRRVSQ